jgi:hypothetical protein
MSEGPGLADKVLAVHRALDSAKVPHAIGGALALAYYGEPRATVDVDVNLFVPASEFPRIVALLEPLGVTAGEARSIERDGQVRLWWGMNPVDLFFAYDPFHDAMASAVRRVEFRDASIPILSPEHLIVCKAVFDRSKDWLDIEQMMIGVPDLDHGEVESWLVAIAGPYNPRVDRLRDLRDRVEG